MNKYQKRFNQTKKSIFKISSVTKRIIDQILKLNPQKNNQYNNYNNTRYKRKNATTIKLVKKWNIKTRQNDIKIVSPLPPPRLSHETIRAIKNIKKERKNRFEGIKTGEKKLFSESSFSKLQLKYDELILQKRQLRLPIKYKNLLKSFTYLEKVLNNNNKNTFENIKASIEF